MAAVNVTTAATPPSRTNDIGPFYWNGRVFVVGRGGGASADVIRCYSATFSESAGAGTFAEDDSANAGKSGNVSSWDSCYASADNRFINIVTWADSGGTTYVEYHEFDMSTRTWSIVNQLVTSFANTTGLGTAIVFGVNDGDIVVLCQAGDDTVSGTPYNRLEFFVHQGTSWTDQNGLLAGTSTDMVHYQYIAGVIGENGNIHFVYYDGTNWKHNTLNVSTWAIGTPQTIGSSVWNTNQPNLAYYNDAGTERIYWAYTQNGGTPTRAAYITEVTEGGTPSTPVRMSDVQVYQQSTSNIWQWSGAIAVDPSTGDVWFGFADQTNRDLYYIDEANFDTGETNYSTESIEDISVHVFTTDEGDVILGFAYEDDDYGGTQFNYLTLHVGGISAALSKAEASDSLTSATAISIAASLSKTEASDSLSGATALAVAAALNKIQASDSLSSITDVVITANQSADQAADTLAGVGQVNITASQTAVQAADSLSSTTQIAIDAIANTTQSSDTLTAAGQVDIVAELSASQVGDTLASVLSIEGGIVASLDATQASDTLTSVADIDIAATVTKNEGSDSITSTALLDIVGAVNDSPAADTLSSATQIDIVSSLNVLQDSDTLSATAVMGGSPISAELDATEASDNLTSVTQINIIAAVNTSQSGDTLLASASNDIAATASILQVADSITADADIVIAATSDTTENSDTLSSSSGLVVSAVGNAVQSSDTLAAIGQLDLVATATITEDGDTLTGFFTIGDVIAAFLDADEASDGLTSTGTLDVAASVDDVPASDTLSSASTLAIIGNVSSSQESDTLASVLASIIAASLDVNQSGDTLVASGVVPLAGDLNATESGDTLASEAAISLVAFLSIDQAQDSILALVSLPISSTLSTAETGDTLASNFTIVWLERLAALDTVEIGDTLASSAKIDILSLLNATQVADTLIGTGDLDVVAQIIGSQSDTVVADADVSISADLSGVEAGDQITGQIINGLIVVLTSDEWANWRRVRLTERRMERFAARIERDILQDFCKIYPASYEVQASGTYVRVIGPAYTYKGSDEIPCSIFESRPFKEEMLYDQEITANEYELHVPRDAPLRADTLVDVKGRRYQIRKMYDQLTYAPTKSARVIEVQFGDEVPTFIVQSITAVIIGLSVTFSVSVLDAVGVVSYLWTFGDGTGDIVASPIHVYTAPGTYAVKVKVTDSTGAFQYARGSVTVT